MKLSEEIIERVREKHELLNLIVEATKGCYIPKIAKIEMEIIEELEELLSEKRYNHNHDPLTGRFTSGGVDKSGDSGIIREKDIVIPMEKFTQYILNPQKSPDKSRVFKSILGFTSENAELLIKQIHNNLDLNSLKEKPDKGYGKRYEALVSVIGANGKMAKVTTAWIKDNSNNEFRLVSAYINTKRRSEQ